MTTAQFMEAYATIPAITQEKVLFGLLINQDLSALTQRYAPIVAPKRRADLPDTTDALDFPEHTDLQKVAKYRASLVAEIWEPDLDRQLVDRIVFAVVVKMTSAKKVHSWINRARNRITEYENTDGRRGVPTLWMSLGKWCKELYEENGIEWKKVRGGQEPEPIREKPGVKQEPKEEEEKTQEITEEERARLDAFSAQMRRRYAEKIAIKSPQ